MAYIKKEPIIEFIIKGLNNPDKKKAYGYDAIEILTEIEFTPTADVVEVKHGKWIDVYKGKYHNKLFVCSICGGKALYKFVTNELGNKRTIQDLTLGCPHCLARMEGD